MLQASVAAVLDGVTQERVKIESISAASVVVAFYVEDDNNAGTLSSDDATALMLAMDASILQNSFPGFVGVSEAPVRKLRMF
jgi:hypothetical protein